MIEQNIIISKFKPLSGSSYIKLPKEINHSKKGLINLQNSNYKKNLKWCLIRYLNPADHHPARIRKNDKNFRYIKFPVKIRDIHKI